MKPVFKKQVFKKVGLLALVMSLAACNTAVTQGVTQATQGVLPQMVQGAMATGADGQQTATGAATNAASQGAQSALAQATSNLMPQAITGAQTAAPSSPILINSNEAHFFSKSGLQACGGGALAGIVTCKITKTCDSDKGALKAAVLGCGIGIGANYYLDYQRNQYGSAEQRLDALIADVQSDNRKLQLLTQQAQQVLTEDKAKLISLQQGIRSKTLQQAQAQAQIAQIDANTQYLTKNLTDLNTRQQQWQDVANSERGQSPKVEALDAEISRMQKQIVTLQQSVQSVAQQRATVVLG